MKKILVLTQIVDRQDAVLGFFHRWIIILSSYFEQVHVICLKTGDYSLPDNVMVHSLGKEEGTGKIERAARLYQYAWIYRKEYDMVFVHMNQEYVLLAGLVWKILGKKIYMWRNHYSGSFLTHIAAFLSTTVFYTSNSSYTARFKNSMRMPIGIDSDIFSCPAGDRKTKSLLYVGRIASSKRVMELLQGVQSASRKGYQYTVSIVGPCITEEDQQYQTALKMYASNEGLQVSFKGPKTWEELPNEYCSHEVCINLSPPGMFDKVIGEALCCGSQVITTNNDARKAPGVTVIDTNGDVSALLADALTSRQQNDGAAGRTYIIKNHSLETLAKKLAQEFGA